MLETKMKQQDLDYPFSAVRAQYHGPQRQHKDLPAKPAPLNAGLPPLPGFFNAEEGVLEVSWAQENHLPNRQPPLFLTVDQQGGRTVGEREEFLPSSANPNDQQNTLRAAVGHSL